jgi:hypothetical protein
MKTEQTEDRVFFIPIKPYMLCELAALYGTSRVTMRKWLKKIEKETGKREGRFYSIPQVKIIFDILDTPTMLKVIEPISIMPIKETQRRAA